MRILYLGCGHVSVPVFERIVESEFSVVGLVLSDISGDVPSTKSTCEKIIEVAKNSGISIYPPENMHEAINKTDPEVLLVNNFIDIISQEIIEQHLCLNVHFGLLPRYRGLHATHWAMLNDESEVGYTVYRMTEEVDQGPILHQERLDVRESDDIHTLLDRITEASVSGVYESLTRLENGEASFRRQSECEALYVQRRKPPDGQVDWSWPARRIWNLTRVLQPPYSPAFTRWEGTRLEIHSARARPTPEYFEIPGHVVAVRGDEVWVKAGDGVVIIEELSEPKSTPKPASEYLSRPGIRLYPE
jgi:methionyl-tRNA formyltransferase